MQTIEELKQDLEQCGEHVCKLSAEIHAEEPEVHTPIEMDPVADFEKARAAMEEQLRRAHAERDKTKALHDKALMELSAATSELNRFKAANEQLRGNVADLSKKIRIMENNHKCEVRALREEVTRLRKLVERPIAKLLVGFGAAVVLAVLVAVATHMDLVVCRLGEPLTYGLLCLACFFGGLICERCRRR